MSVHSGRCWVSCHVTGVELESRCCTGGYRCGVDDSKQRDVCSGFSYGSCPNDNCQEPTHKGAGASQADSKQRYSNDDAEMSPQGSHKGRSDLFPLSCETD